MAQERAVELVQPLSDSGDDPSAELLVLVSILRSRDPARRLAAARALQRVGAPAVPSLLAALQEEGEAASRESYIKALGMMGSAARPALPALEALSEDDALGLAARDAARAIRRGWRPDWKQLAETALPWVVSFFVVAAVVNEVVSWLGLFDHLEGLALQVALVWAFLGAVSGALFGANCRSEWVAKKGVQYLGAAGACAGAALGRWVGTLLEPLVQVLSR
jgi:hypothetical protein